MRRLIVSADDFGLSEEVNEAIEIAHRDGLLSTASLMVAGPASVDAVRRAKRLPGLRVGLHLVVIEGDTALPGATIPAIATPDDRFGTSQLGLGIDYFFRPSARRALAREIEAQFRAFVASGLRLDHANAHKHMHLHPTVGRLLIETGLHYGLRHVRTPCEPPAPLAAAETHFDSLGASALRRWCGVLRHQIARAGMTTNDSCFGVAWSGQMRAGRVAGLVPHLPEGLSELYFHPALEQNALLQSLMPDYDQRGEFDALISPELRDAVRRSGIALTDWAGATLPQA
ncbi:hopanoid biosynthesis-associated protein HpnK [Asaia lannensis]|uniref:Hopanoid biosynthesis-associated protein HpnK n=1 Tax=Asaia lannensis NBRC 102526 TaxID=1307926 RepID=A0ABT1CEC6_9PROT|nr:hopanoid biosynthesis-associated protein HpnK [Asaia lannensis]MCO6158604.1 hopanoid biosynthesis-associated protein HpnK [Asaia lannensis NBRC 102526]GBR00687.1 sugar phosphotransferase system protein [Asaia lannensis NBRC 102526]